MLTDFLSVLGSRQARPPLNFIGTRWPTEVCASADVAEKQVKQILETNYTLQSIFPKQSDLTLHDLIFEL